MAAKSIVWSLQARNDRREILKFWFVHTGNKRYSEKLARLFREATHYLARFNYLGRATDIKNVRVTVCGDYLIFYRITRLSIEIITLFDNRRNPKEVNIS